MFLFCFKQKTAYEMRISDWSSDVCSSDLERSAVVGPSRRRRLLFSEQCAVAAHQHRVRLVEQTRNRAAHAREHRGSEFLSHSFEILLRLRDHAVERRDRKSTRLNSSH